MNSNKLLINVTDFDAGLIAAKTFLQHNHNYDVSTFTESREIYNLLNKANLNPVLGKLDANILFKNISESNCNFLVVLTQYSLTKDKVFTKINGDELNCDDCDWEVAIRPYFPGVFFSKIVETYDMMGVEYTDKNIKVGFPGNVKLSDKILIFNAGRIREKEFNQEYLFSDNSKINAINEKVNTSLIYEKFFTEVESFVFNCMPAADILSNKQRLELANVTAFRDTCKFWDTNLPIKMLAQLNLEQYHHILNEYYNDIQDKSRLDDIQININRITDRFGRMEALYKFSEETAIYI